MPNHILAVTIHCLTWYFKWHNFPNHFIYPKKPRTFLLHLMVQVKSDNNLESPPFLCPNSLNNQVLLVLSHFSTVLVQMLKGPLRFLCLNPWSPTEVAAWEAVQSLRCRAWLVKVSHLGQAFEGVQLGLLLNWALSTSWSASVRSLPWKPRPPRAPQLSYLPTFTLNRAQINLKPLQSQRWREGCNIANSWTGPPCESATFSSGPSCVFVLCTPLVCFLSSGWSDNVWFILMLIVFIGSCYVQPFEGQLFFF